MHVLNISLDAPGSKVHFHGHKNEILPKGYRTYVTCKLYIISWIHIF